MTGPFRILVVSVGNDCRSPLAERHLRHKFDLVLGDAADTVDISSAGVRAVEGAPMDALAAKELQRLGGAPDGFVARQLTRAMMREADLVLAVTRALRSRALEDEPAALRRTFTLREFATLARLLQPERSPEAFVSKAAGHRWAVGSEDYDLADPTEGARRRHREVAELIGEASTSITDLWQAMVSATGTAV